MEEFEFLFLRVFSSLFSEKEVRTFKPEIGEVMGRVKIDQQVICVRGCDHLHMSFSLRTPEDILIRYTFVRVSGPTFETYHLNHGFKNDGYRMWLGGNGPISAAEDEIQNFMIAAEALDLPGKGTMAIGEFNPSAHEIAIRISRIQEAEKVYLTRTRP